MTTPTQLPVPSEKPQDLKFNAGKIDEFVTSMGWTYTDRFGNKHYTIEGVNYLAQQVMNAFGYITLTGVDFDTGATVSTPNEVLFNPADNSYYKWTGSFASGGKVVPQGSTPESTGGIGPGAWLSVGDASVRPWVSQNFEEAEYKKLQNVSFATGTTILNADEVLFNAATGFYYQYKGQLPVTVAPGSTPDANWRCVGDANYPLTVESFGAVAYTVPSDESIPDTAISASTAFQLMFDNMGYINVPDGNTFGYLIDAPVRLFGQQRWTVDLKGCVIAKVTSTKTGLADYIPMSGTYVEGNVNCVFMVNGPTCRYWEFIGGYIDCHLAPSEDRPVGIYIAEAVGYKIERVLTRGCKTALWVKSAWLGEINLCRFSENTSHGVFYDSTRFTSTGAAAPVAQTATSLHVSSSYVAYAQMDGWHMEKCQYINFQSAACDGAGSIAGGSAYYFSECDVVGDIGAESPSSSATAYLQLAGGTATLCLNTYDTLTTPNPVVLVSGQAVATISLALRTQRTRLFTIQGAGSYIRVPLLTFWNGSTTTPAGSLVDTGSFLRIESARDTKGYLDFTDGKMQRSNGYTAAYQARPSALTPYTHKEARYGVPAGSTTVSVPLADLVEIFPNFNRSSNTFVEWLQVSTRNGPGITYGAIVACTANAITGSKVDSQISTGNGSAQAVVSSFSVSGGNLVITYAGSIATDSIVIFRPA